MKNTNNYLRLIILLFLFNGLVIAAIAKNEVKQLICEYKTNPMGIDVAKPRLSWQLVSAENDVMQAAYEIKVAESPAKLNSGKLIWSTGKVNSSQSVSVIYDGPALQSMQQLYWQVRVWDNKNKATAWSTPASWEMGILKPTDWKATWITFGAEKEMKGSKPAQYFRKEFTTAKKVKSARIYTTALGLYQLHLNGAKVTSDLFTPGWTSYKKRLQYQTYDVTSMLKAQNAIGVVLADGWFRGNIGFSQQSSYYGKQLALLLQLQISYTDETVETISSDNSWKVTQNGPIVESDIYNGELYDARLELTGWDQAGFDMSKWDNVTAFNQSNDILIAPQGVPVKAIQEIKPIKLIVTPIGETIFDMGQNMVGWVRLKVAGKKGDRVTLKFAEVLDKAGNFYTDNLRAAKATDVYLLKGEGTEIYEPGFTFHGFRFVKIEGLAVAPTLDQITGIVVHSDMKPTGTFACSDTLINQLQHNIQWGQKGNFVDVPTDCPQRDERLGWTGDAQVFSMTAAFNFDVAAFYTKWMGDFTADQSPDGKVPYVIPDVLNGSGGSTAWADAAIIVPWTVYLAYGDQRILQAQYPSMKAWVGYMTSRAGADYIWTGDFHFGDWLAFATTRSDYPGATTEKDLIATAYYYYSTNLLSKIAAIIGQKEDASNYQKLANDIKSAFIQEFVTPNGRLVSHTQTAYALALAFNLLPENLIPKAAEYFAGDVKKFGHLTTGFVGTPLLCKTLSSIGRDDLAFMLLNNKKYPSWLYPVLQGATTIWERWDGQKPDGTFQDVGMNSFNHYAYGAIGEWLYRHVAGIDIDYNHPGYKHVLLAPHPGGGLKNASAEILTLYGKVSSSWKFENEDFVYEVVIPANTNATITLPYAKADQVKQDGLPLKAGSVQNNNDLQINMGSGKYVFRYPAQALTAAIAEKKK
ncbi:MAG: family 78 glycoside hydrolase catalytic domain [Bacteroidia bacterium]|nr:family 78 glycoside hydrolase catalytic domain [Bacteroidia bacterium]